MAVENERGAASEAPPIQSPGRLGIYVDTVFRGSEGRPSTAWTNGETFPFMVFVCEIASHFSELVLFGRQAPPPGTGGQTEAGNALPRPAVVKHLPYYRSFNRPIQVLRAAPGTAWRMWRGLRATDTVVAFGPHPFGLLLAVMAVVQGKRVVLGVRQDTMEYFERRLPHRLLRPILIPLRAVDLIYRWLSHRLPTLVVGAFLEAQYGGPRSGLLATRISLVRLADIAPGPSEKERATPVDLITVGRVEPEKNPMLLLDTLALLDQRDPGSYHLTWIGEGQLLPAVKARAAELGLSSRISFKGYVPFGPDLLALYRSADTFVHVATTEAFGQVLTEAMASATPIVATGVGGVPDALADGRAGILVPPDDSQALADAVEAVELDEDGRLTRIAEGLRLAYQGSLESETERVAAFLLDARPRKRSRARSAGPRNASDDRLGCKR